MLNRIIAVLLVFAIIILCFPLPAYASTELAVPDSSSGEILFVAAWESFYEAVYQFVSKSYELLGPFIEAIYGSYKSNGYFDALLDRDVALYCFEADKETDGGYPYHYWVGGLLPSSQSCKYCGLSYTDYLAILSDSYDAYVQSLSGTSLELSLTLSETCLENLETALSSGYLLSYTAAENSVDFVIGTNSGKWTSAGSGSGYVFSPSATHIGTWYTDSFYLAEDGTYTFTFPALSTLGCSYALFYCDKFYEGEWIQCGASSGYQRTEIESDSFLTGYSLVPNALTQKLVGGYEYRIRVSLGVDDFRSSSAQGNVYFTGAAGYAHFLDSVYISKVGDSDGTVYDPTDTEADEEIYSVESRVAYLIDLLAQYNRANSCLGDSEAVNFFVGSVDEDGNISGVFDLPEFDEETLIFTEPVTGAQYQCTGWTYNYVTRTYDLSLDEGTFLIGSTDITRILCTYGNDAVTIAYYDASGTLVQSDEFAYVTVASSACALDGHSYTVETTKEPTCTSVGERVYTCSVCGDQYVETIPMNEHAHVYTQIKEATCTDPGYGTFTCSTCGGQYTETIDPLGHDWISTEVVATSYTLPPGTACPDCSSSDLACELDELSATYSCTCNSCGTAWTVNAEVTQGYTTYTCSRCGKTKVEFDGESGDGLFKSIGNFFADGINWCTEKLSQLVDSLTTIVDTFNEYLDAIPQSGAYPNFLGAFLEALPPDLTAIIWLGVIAFVVLAVFKIWFR